MSENSLTRFELQSIRKLLMLEVAEAAKCIGKVTPRSWQHWERGDRAIPVEVNLEMYDLLKQRRNLINQLLSEKSFQNRVHKWYVSFDLFEKDFPGISEKWWRFYQSVIAGAIDATTSKVKLSDDEPTDKTSVMYLYLIEKNKKDAKRAQ